MHRKPREWQLWFLYHLVAKYLNVDKYICDAYKHTPENVGEINQTNVVFK